MSVDKVCIRYRYDFTSEASDEYQQLYGFKYSLLDGSFGKKGKVWPCMHGPMTNMSLYMGSGAGLYIRFGHAKKQRWAWLTFNPSKMETSDFDELRGYSTLLYTNGIDTLWDKGDLARIDIAFDVSASLADLVVIDDSLRTEDVSLQSSGTVYLGAEGGARNFAIYDKRKERFDVAGLILDDPWLRIEARLIDRKRRFHQMNEVINPFSHLRIVEKARLQSATGPLAKRFRAGLEFGYNPTSLLSYFSNPIRGALLEELSDLAPTWWDAEQMWKLYPDALEWVHKL